MSHKHDVTNGIARGVAKFWRCEELQDFTVDVDGVHFGCHRFLLAACSDFFRGLFRSGMQEIEQKKVNLKDISSETFELIMESMYTGHVVLTKDNVTNIWRAAHQLQIPFLLSESENFVLNTLSLDNYEEYFYTANTLSSSVVLERLRTFVLKNCNSFFHTNFFLELPIDEVLSLIRSQDLETKSEDDVIDAILKWVEFQGNRDQISCITGEDNEHSCEKDIVQENGATDGDKSCSNMCKYCKCISTDSSSGDRNVNDSSRGERNEKQIVTNKNITLLLSNSRIYLASKRCLEMLLRHPLVTDNKEARDVIIDSLLYQLQGSKRNGHWPSRAVHRNNSLFLHCIANIIHFKGSNKLVAYSVATKEMSVIKCLENFKNAKIFKVHNEFYVVYDMCSKEDTSRTIALCFQPLMKESALITILSITLRSEGVFVAVVDSRVFIFSAHEQKVWKLETTPQETLDEFSLPGTENIAYLVVYGHNIIVFYASTDEGVGETVVQFYDTLQNTWSQKTQLEGKAQGMISFDDDHFTYLLQSNGKLWRVVKPHSNIIDFELVAQIWGCELALHGAITYLDDLYIGIKSTGNLPDKRQLMRSLPGVFREITYYALDATDGAMFLPVLLSDIEFYRSLAPDYLHSKIKIL